MVAKISEGNPVRRGASFLYTEVAIKGFATLYCQASIIRVAKTFDSDLCNTVVVAAANS
jgi:hypothetical protein